VIVRNPARDSAFCGTRSGSLFADVLRDGTVNLCDHPNPSPDDVCLQDFDSRAPVLASGHASEVNGFRCMSAPQAITCTVIDGGPGTGRGFEIRASAVAPVGPTSGSPTIERTPPAAASTCDGPTTTAPAHHRR
jgi:hypothetical protein